MESSRDCTFSRLHNKRQPRVDAVRRLLRFLCWCHRYALEPLRRLLEIQQWTVLRSSMLVMLPELVVDEFVCAVNPLARPGRENFSPFMSALQRALVQQLVQTKPAPACFSLRQHWSHHLSSCSGDVAEPPDNAGGLIFGIDTGFPLSNSDTQVFMRPHLTAPDKEPTL